MNESVIQILNWKLFARSPEIAILIEKSKHMSINACEQAIAPNVEFSPIY